MALNVLDRVFNRGKLTVSSIAPIPATTPEAGFGSPGYDRWASGVFRNAPRAPRTPLYSSFDPSSKWGASILKAMNDVEREYAIELLARLAASGIDGAIVEFGVFDGTWLSVLADAVEAQGRQTEIYGFDSFEGLPKPSATADLDCWTEGQYAADIDAVGKRLKTDKRTNVHLIKGWFSDTLPAAKAQAIKKIAYARIDCDLYGPAVECLAYLQPRLVDGAVLVFDDWTWDLTKGETKAFHEWVNHSGIAFEMLEFNSTGHLYLRVRR